MATSENQNNIFNTNKLITMKPKDVLAILSLLILHVSCDEVACRDKHRLLGTDFEDKYQLTEVILGETYQLKCHYCDENDDARPKLWYYEKRLIFDDVPEEVKLGMSQNKSDNHYLMDFEHGLVIQNVSSDDAGIYFCHGPYQDEYNKYNYFLDVVSKSIQPLIGQTEEEFDKYVEQYITPMNSNFTSSQHKDFVSLRETYGILLTILYEWESWERCDPCKNVRKRHSKCMLKPEVYQEDKLIQLNITEETAKLVYLNSFELSCYSIEIKPHFPHIYDMLQTIPEFYLVESCHSYGELCNPDSSQTLRREPYYRNHHLLPEGSDVFLTCPESSVDTQVVWRKDGKVLENLGPNSKVVINSFYTLFIMDGSWFENSGNYTCYVDGVRMQETIVNFISGDLLKQATYKRHISYLTYIFILTFILYIGGLARVYSRRHSFRQLSWEEYQRNVNDTRRLQVIVEEDSRDA